MQNNDVLETLSADMKARLRGCETPEEILALANEEGYELTEEQLDGVTGGWDGHTSRGSYGSSCGGEGGPA